MTDTPTGPTVFNDRYELHRKLARGGMADVYLAKDLLLDRPVAVKVLFPEHARDESFVERFRREAQAAANLNHPNVVAVYDWGQQFGTYFIVMEYVEGRPLADVIQSEGPLHPVRAAEITSEVAAALGFAHRNGVVHRDVKPGNILITPTGQVKVADFGIAQATSSGDASVNLTQAGAVMGTATYFSPEQAQGHPVDARSDLYSLGCVLYEMLTTRPPFSGDTPVAVAFKHVQERVIPPSQINPSVPAPLEAIDMKLLDKDAVLRYQSAEDLRADIARFLDGQPVGAAATFGAGGFAATGAAVGVGAAMAGDPTTAIPAASMGGGGAYPPGPPTGSVPFGTPEPKRRNGLYIGLVVGALVIIGVVLLIIGSNMGQSVEQVDVPDVTGQSVTDASNNLRNAGFKVTTKSQPNDTVPVDQVFDQNPKGNTKADKGATVEIIYSGGVGEVKVPDVVSRTQSAAESLLRSSDLIPEVLSEASDLVPAGEVIRQSPAAGVTVAKRTVVQITVSTGAAKVAVPGGLVGQSATAVSNELGQLGFRVEQQNQSSSTVAAGLVISTNPGAGTELTKGATVTIVVSTGPPATSSTSSTTSSP